MCCLFVVKRQVSNLGKNPMNLTYFSGYSLPLTV